MGSENCLENMQWSFVNSDRPGHFVLRTLYFGTVQPNAKQANAEDAEYAENTGEWQKHATVFCRPVAM